MNLVVRALFLPVFPRQPVYRILLFSLKFRLMRQSNPKLRLSEIPKAENQCIRIKNEFAQPGYAYRLGYVYSSSSTITFTLPLWPVQASSAMIPFP